MQAAGKYNQARLHLGFIIQDLKIQYANQKLDLIFTKIDFPKLLRQYKKTSI